MQLTHALSRATDGQEYAPAVAGKLGIEPEMWGRRFVVGEWAVVVGQPKAGKSPAFETVPAENRSENLDGERPRPTRSLMEVDT